MYRFGWSRGRDRNGAGTGPRTGPGTGPERVGSQKPGKDRNYFPGPAPGTGKGPEQGPETGPVDYDCY